MGNFFLLQTNGFFLLQTNGDKIIIDTFTDDVGGGSGGSSKQVGVSLVKKQLGDRPTFTESHLATSTLAYSQRNESKGKIVFTLRVKAEGIVKILSGNGLSFGSILYTEKLLSFSKTKIHLKAESMGAVTTPLKLIHGIKQIQSESSSKTTQLKLKIETMIKKQNHLLQKKDEKISKLTKLTKYLSILQMIESIGDNIQTFSFAEKTNNEKLIAFTGSSSFVGNVRYDDEDQSMRIILNGKVYNFCNVPQRIFDSFEGAASKGAFFGRSIKGQFDC